MTDALCVATFAVDERHKSRKNPCCPERKSSKRTESFLRRNEKSGAWGLKKKLKKGIQLMKNSIKLLAAAVAAATALDASAAQIYSKDDTTLDVTGLVEAVYFDGNNGMVKDADSDSTIGNRARFGLEGRTKIASGIYGFGKFEHQWQNNGDSSGSDESARDQYVGVDFGQGGVIKAGRFLPNEYKVESVTDVFERNGAYGEQYGSRCSGLINYEISYAGFSAALEYQSATNNAQFDAGGADIDVDHGFSAVLGYTSPAVLFGPIGVQLSAGYEKFQDDAISDATPFRVAENKKKKDYGYLDKASDFGVSLTWGTYGSGLYLASFYEQRKCEAYDAYNALEGDNDLTVKSSESLVAYSFANGVTLHASYQWKDYSPDDDDDSVSSIYRKVPLMVSWDINPNFRVWGTDIIDAGSSDDIDDHNRVEIGARYIF